MSNNRNPQGNRNKSNVRHAAIERRGPPTTSNGDGMRQSNNFEMSDLRTDTYRQSTDSPPMSPPSSDDRRDRPLLSSSQALPSKSTSTSSQNLGPLYIPPSSTSSSPSFRPVIPSTLPPSARQDSINSQGGYAGPGYSAGPAVDGGHGPMQLAQRSQASSRQNSGSYQQVPPHAIQGGESQREDQLRKQQGNHGGSYRLSSSKLNASSKLSLPDDNQLLQCPKCMQLFKKGASNSIINEHVMNCKGNGKKQRPEPKISKKERLSNQFKHKLMHGMTGHKKTEVNAEIAGEYAFPCSVHRVDFDCWEMTGQGHTSIERESAISWSVVVRDVVLDTLVECNLTAERKFRLVRGIAIGWQCSNALNDLITEYAIVFTQRKDCIKFWRHLCDVLADPRQQLMSLCSSSHRQKNKALDLLESDNFDDMFNENISSTLSNEDMAPPSSICKRMGQYKCCGRLPVILDLVSDKVRFRSITLLLWTAMFCFIVYLVYGPVLRLQAQQLFDDEHAIQQAILKRTTQAKLSVTVHQLKHIPNRYPGVGPVSVCHLLNICSGTGVPPSPFLLIQPQHFAFFWDPLSTLAKSFLYSNDASPVVEETFNFYLTPEELTQENMEVGLRVLDGGEDAGMCWFSSSDKPICHVGIARMKIEGPDDRGESSEMLILPIYSEGILDQTKYTSTPPSYSFERGKLGSNVGDWSGLGLDPYKTKGFMKVSYRLKLPPEWLGIDAFGNHFTYNISRMNVTEPTIEYQGTTLEMWERSKWYLRFFFFSAIPLFLANSQFAAPWIIVPSLFYAMGGTYFGLVYVEIWQNPLVDHVGISLETRFITAVNMLSLFVVPVLLWCTLMVVVMGLRHRCEHTQTRQSKYHHLVRKLLVPGYGVANNRRAMMHARPMRQAGCGKIIDAVWGRTPLNPHKYYQTGADFHYPQRLMLSCSLSFVFIFACFSGAIYIQRKVNLSIESYFEAYNNYMEQSAHSVVILRSLISRMKSQNIMTNFVANKVSRTVENLAPPSCDLLEKTSGFSEVLCNSFLKSLMTFDSNSRSIVDEFTWAIETTVWSLCIAMTLIVCCVWFDIFKTYRENIMKLRTGHIWFDKHRYLMYTAYNYVGLQAAHMLLCFIIFVCIMFLVVFPFVHPYLRSMIWDSLLAPITTYAIATIIFEQSVQLFAGFYFVQYQQVKHLRLFLLFDFVFTYLGVISAVLLSFARLCVLSFVRFLQYMRLDTNKSDLDHDSLTTHLDFGYSAYINMLIVDYHHNHPIMTTFVSLLMEDKAKRADKLQERDENSLSVVDRLGTRWVWGPNGSACPELLHAPSRFASGCLRPCYPADGGKPYYRYYNSRVVTRFWLGFILSRNPKLCLERKAAINERWDELLGSLRNTQSQDHIVVNPLLKRESFTMHRKIIEHRVHMNT